MMKSAFNTESSVIVLFKQFQVETPLGLSLACIIFVLLSVVYEGLKCLRLNQAERSGWRQLKKTCFTRAHGIQTALHMAEFLFSYALMLAAMTFNVWLFISIVTGSTIGLQLCNYFRGTHMSRIQRRQAPVDRDHQCSTKKNNEPEDNVSESEAEMVEMITSSI